MKVANLTAQPTASRTSAVVRLTGMSASVNTT